MRGHWRYAVVVFLSALVGMLTPAPGWAGGVVVSSSPAGQAILATAPLLVDLVCSAPPDPGLSHVSVRLDSGSTVDPESTVDSGPLVAEGPNGLRQPVSITSSGNYSVIYHVVFVDGTDAVGIFRFSVGTAVAPPAPTGVDQQAAQLADQGGQHDHGVDAVGAVLLAVDLAVLLVVGVLLLRRPRRAVLTENRADIPDA